MQLETYMASHSSCVVCFMPKFLSNSMSFLENLYQKLESRIDQLLAHSNWRWKVTGISVLFVFLSFFNNISPLKGFSNFYEDAFVKKGEFFLYQVTKDRSENLTEHRIYKEPASNNRVFRLTLPLLVKILHVRHVSIFLYGLQLVLGVLMFYLLSGFIYRLTSDKTSTLLACVSIACIYFGASFFIEFGGYGDFYSYFFLFLALYFRFPVLVFSNIVAASWCDERAVLASTLVFTYWWLEKTCRDKTYQLKFLPNQQMLAVGFAILSYFVIRFYLVDSLGMEATYKDGEFTEQLLGSLPSYGFKMTWILEGFWIALLLSFIILFSEKKYLILGLILLASVGMIISGFTTYDSTRSGTFVFPMIFISIIIINNQLTQREMRVVLLLIALLCFLHPLANKTHGVGYFLM